MSECDKCAATQAELTKERAQWRGLTAADVEHACGIIDDELETLTAECDALQAQVEALTIELERKETGVREEITCLREINYAIKAQLPEGMEHCFIKFLECPVGHGRLTATNWIDHGCSTCDRDALALALKEANAEIERLRKRFTPPVEDPSIVDPEPIF